MFPEVDGPEKRRFYRLALLQAASCKLQGSGLKKYQLMSMLELPITLINLSPGGACIECENHVGSLGITRDSTVELKISCKGIPLDLQGRIVWTEKRDKGIRAGLIFDNLKGEKNDRLLQFLKEESSRQ